MFGNATCGRWAGRGVRRGMRRVGFVLGLAATVFATTPALAWACAGPSAAKLESPRLAKAPLNVHLRVRFSSKPSPDDLREITLRSAAGRVVPFRATELREHLGARTSHAAPLFLMELVPRQPLQPNTTYELSWKMSERALREFPSPPHGAELSIGSFATGGTKDEQAPVMPASLDSVFVDRGWVSHTYKGGPTARLRAWPQGLIRIDAVTDDLTPADELYYWVWRVGEERSAFSLTRPRRHVLTVGDGEPPYECESSFEFPFLKRERRFLIAVVAVDLAGNLSQIRHVVLERNRLKRSVPREFRG